MSDPVLMIPDEVQKNHILLAGTTGAGKSNTARTIVEYNMWKGRRTLIIDVTGDWWGIKSSADGRKSGLPFIVFGGEHADIPIDTNMGAQLGQILATKNIPAVIDLQLFSPERMATFLTPFFENMYRLNREVLHLVLDEAHRYLPQQVRSFQARLVHQIGDIVTGGRSRGFKLMIVTQRPAKINKDPIAMCKTFILHEMPSSHDRKAIRDMIQDGDGMDAARMKEIMGSMPSLPTGEAWVWIPKMKILERRQFPLAQTFDSGAAPDDGETKREPMKLAHIDLDAIRGMLAPKEPKGQPEARQDGAGGGDYARGYAAAKKALTEAHDAEKGRMERQMARTLEDIRKKIAHVATSTQGAAAVVEALLENFPEPPSAQDVKLWQRPVIAETPPRSTPRPSGAPKNAEQKVIDAIAWWGALRNGWPTKTQLCAVAGYSPTASTIGVYLAQLKRNGYVEAENGAIALTPEGTARATAPDVPASKSALRERIKNILSPAECNILQPILDAFPAVMSRAELCDATGLSPTASTVGVYLAALRRYGFVERGKIKAADWLF